MKSNGYKAVAALSLLTLIALPSASFATTRGLTRQTISRNEVTARHDLAHEDSRINHWQARKAQDTAKYGPRSPQEQRDEALLSSSVGRAQQLDRDIVADRQTLRQH